MKHNKNTYYGDNTESALTHFNIGYEKMPLPVIKALLTIKKAAAHINAELGVISKAKATPIVEAAEFFLARLTHEHFPLRIWQTGSGTQTHMNVNEVIAAKANEILGHHRQAKQPVHPNDHVNASQSTNDTFSTAMQMAVIDYATAHLLPALKDMEAVLLEKSAYFKGIIKIGRTHLQDATPLYLSDEFRTFHHQIKDARLWISEALKPLYYLPQGGTAVGTGLNAHPQFAPHVAARLEALTGHQFKAAESKFLGLACHDNIVQFSGGLNTLAGALMKIANDIRWLASGPRCGIGEITIPANEAGSSIMPGKVNPTQAEALTMVAVRVMGNHTATSIAGSQGNFQLNVYKPLIIYNTLQSLQLLSDSIKCFTKYCLEGIEANRARIEEYAQNSLMLVTALSPLIGYEKAAQAAKYAHEKGLTLREAVLELKLIPAHVFDEKIKLENLVSPHA